MIKNVKEDLFMLFDEYGDLLNLTDISEILGVSQATAARLCKKRKIKAFKAGREWRATKLELESYVYNESHDFPLT